MAYPGTLNIFVYKGDTLEEIYDVGTPNSAEDDIETPIDLTGYTVELELRAQGTAAVITTLSTDTSGIEMTDAVNGRFTISMNAAQTEALTFKRASLRLRLITDDNKVFTEAIGVFTVED